MKHRALTLASSEAEAIERAKQGDAEAFALLYGLHKRRVYSLCLRMTANSAKAEDLTQEAFLHFYSCFARLELFAASLLFPLGCTEWQ
jgi:DNA-directed RNA polymerase specialized sigma24 family protein